MGRTLRGASIALVALLYGLSACSPAPSEVTSSAPTTDTPPSTSTPTSTPTTTAVVASPNVTTVPVPPSGPPGTIPVPVAANPRPTWPPFIRTTAAVIPAFVAFVDEAAQTVSTKPTLGNSPATQLHRVREGWTIDGLGVTADGASLFVGDRAGCSGSIRRVELAAPKSEVFAEGESAPTVSADGRWMASLVSTEDSGRCRHVLRVRDLESNTHYDIGRSGEYPSGSYAWSPDSTRLAYVACDPRCTLWVDEVAIRTSFSFGTDGTPYGERDSYAVEPLVTWTATGALYARGRCACNPGLATLVASWSDPNRNTSMFVARDEPFEVLAAIAGDNELIVQDDTVSDRRVVRRHGDSPPIAVGVPSNGMVTWPTAQPWKDALSPTGSDGQPRLIVAVVLGSLVFVESETGATVKVAYKSNSIDGFTFDRAHNEAIVGERLEKCGTRLLVVPLDGREVREIGRGVQPSLSPDGRQLAYAASLWERAGVAPPTPSGIGCALSAIVVRTLATNEETLILPPGFDPQHAATGGWENHAKTIGWSPDQRRLAFSYVYEGGVSFVHDLATAVTTRVVVAPALREVMGHRLEITRPAWRSDGSLDLTASCYGCPESAIRVRADDGLTITGTLDALLVLDTYRGHELVYDLGSGSVFSRRIGTRPLVLRREIWEAAWLT